MTKPVLVFYINIGNLCEQDTAEYVDLIKDSLGDFDKEYHKIVIPVRDQETRIDILQPNLIYNGEKEIYKMKSNMKRLTFETNQLLERMPYLSKNLLLIEKV